MNMVFYSNERRAIMNMKLNDMPNFIYRSGYNLKD